VTVGHEPAYGARPLKRAIQREIETPLGRMLLKGEVRDGQHVLANYEGGDALTFTSRQGAPQEEAVGTEK
jgi:ATP-dependent Clp protease ATP-binding subunit ClpB